MIRDWDNPRPPSGVLGTKRPAFTAADFDRPFGLPPDSVEITLDLPMPPSVNRLWRSGRGRVYRSKEYVEWCEQADMAVMATKGLGRLPKISGAFEISVLLAADGRRRDGDNYGSKAVLDWLQSRDIVRNDSDCGRGSWAWVEPDSAPKGCRVIVRSLATRPEPLLAGVAQ